MRLHPTEEQIQAACAAFLDRALPADAVWYAVPNGGHRHPAVAAKLKWTGVKRGVPDIAIVWRGRAIYIEMKAHKGRLATPQVEMHERLTLAGAVVLPIARSVEEVADFLEALGVPLRGKLKGRAA
jgi:hypothetical protein